MLDQVCGGNRLTIGLTLRIHKTSRTDKFATLVLLRSLSVERGAPEWKARVHHDKTADPKKYIDARCTECCEPIGARRRHGGGERLLQGMVEIRRVTQRCHVTSEFQLIRAALRPKAW